MYNIVMRRAGSFLRNTNQMANYESCCETLLIDGDGTFNVDGIENFVKKADLDNYGNSYAVVSIIGPQSSGKSTLLNCLFGTNFKEMNELDGRPKTTEGIWIARCNGIDPPTLVLDVEGTDGRERGEDDTTFEKQSSLFALTVSDIVLINMWCHDIGRENAANMPLLRIIFQVRKKLFDRRITTLLVVIRDLTKTPLRRLEKILREDIERIWENVSDATPLREFFKVKVVALSHYEHKKEEFLKEVAILRQRFFHSISPGGLAGDRYRIPASGFSFSSQQVWEMIKMNKDLDLPSHKVLVATVRCEQIANEKHDTFAANEEWCQLEEDVNHGYVPAFVNKLNSLIVDYLSKYNAESMGYDEGVRSKYLNRLQEIFLQLFKPAFISALEHIRSRTWDEFMNSFDNALNGGEVFSAAAIGCIRSCMSHFDEECPDVVIEQANRDKIEVRNKLQRDIDVHVTSTRATKIYELTSSYQENLKEALAEPVESILGEAKRSTWPSIRNLFSRETESAISRFSAALSGFDADDDTRQEKISSLEAYARGVVEGKARDEATKVRSRMMERFTNLFSYDSYSTPRVWNGEEDIKATAEIARSASLEVLSVMAAIRLNENENDEIEETLKAELMGPPNGRRSKESDPLASTTWEQVPSSRTLITPLRCKQLWDQLLIPETNQIIAEAIGQQRDIWRKLALVWSNIRSFLKRVFRRS